MEFRFEPRAYVFITDRQRLIGYPLANLNPRLIIREENGTTVLTTETLARAHGFPNYSGPFYRVRITLHRNLAFNGFFGEIVNRMMGFGLQIKVFSGFSHDCIYVLCADAHLALDILVIMRNVASREVTIAPWTVAPITSRENGPVTTGRASEAASDTGTETGPTTGST